MRDPKMTWLKEIKARLEKATPGPWTINASSTTTGRVWIESIDEGLYLSCKYPNQQWNMSNDCAFIAHAPEDIKRLLAHVEELSIKLRRTVNASEYALLEMSAWMGIPERKREAQIKEYMENVRYCAEHDLIDRDESARNQALTRDHNRMREALEKAETFMTWLCEDSKKYSGTDAGTAANLKRHDIRKVLDGLEVKGE